MVLKTDRLWCGYFDGNIKSKRVQEKCGFRYHHTKENVPCAIEGVLHTEHISCITKEEYRTAASHSMSSLHMDPLPTREEIREASNAGIIDAVCDYAHVLEKRDWHYIKFRLFAPYTHRCPICSNRKEGKRYGSNCICVPFACWHHGGHIPCHCNTHVINDSSWQRIGEVQDPEEALAIARKRIGVSDIMLIRGPEMMTSLRRGDICAHFSGGKYIHSSLYLGEGKMLDCSLERMRLAVRDVMDCKFAIRYTGGKEYLSRGDSGDAVKKVQEYLNRYFSGSEGWTPLVPDGLYDRDTEEAVKRFQSENNIEADGNTGNTTLAVMRKAATTSTAILI